MIRKPVASILCFFFHFPIFLFYIYNPFRSMKYQLFSFFSFSFSSLYFLFIFSFHFFLAGGLSCLCINENRKSTLEMTINTLTFVVNQYGGETEVHLIICLFNFSIFTSFFLHIPFPALFADFSPFFLYVTFIPL